MSGEITVTLPKERYDELIGQKEALRKILGECPSFTVETWDGYPGRIYLHGDDAVAEVRSMVEEVLSDWENSARLRDKKDTRNNWQWMASRVRKMFGI